MSIFIDSKRFWKIVEPFLSDIAVVLDCTKNTVSFKRISSLNVTIPARISLHSLKKSVMENSVFRTVSGG